ncbi:MAG TPA: hypothetical protein VJ831_13060 [Jatrophihabitantaceae bacterium]|nr:hypothetical protein [Jatrophihabitantaceae bacterium]
MPDYAIEVRYGNGQPTVRIPLSGVTPDEAETDRQLVAHEIEHARELGSPCLIDELRSGPLAERIELAVDGAVEVDLVEA